MDKENLMFKYTRALMVTLVISLCSLSANAGWLSSASQPLEDTTTLTGETLYTPAVKQAWKDDVTNPIKSLFVSGANLAKAPFMMLQGKRCDWK